ncbi:MAG: cation-translocating P-type ATPase [Firmicutes bacterium]|nr:cation-translocating P-type ATPase [Bacillota bacterium]
MLSTTTQSPTTRYNPSYLEGLTTTQVDNRVANGQTNVTPSKITKTNWRIIKDNALTLFNFFNVLIGFFILLLGFFISPSAFRHLLFLLVVVLNISIGIFQEVRGRNLVSKLTILTATQSTVMRNGKTVSIPTEEIVLDDIIVLDAGVQIPADATVLDGEIEVNESLLTGEPNTVIRRKGDTLLSGSFVVSGKCYARADKVGSESFATRLTLGAKKHKYVNSEIMGGMRKITKVTSIIVVPVGLALFLLAYFVRNESMYDSVTTMSASLLGMLPRGLVLLASIALTVGVINLAKKKVLVQEPRAIETLAKIDLLCLDKTGTITEGKMTLTNIVASTNHTMPFGVEEALALFASNTDDNNATADALKQWSVTSGQWSEKKQLSVSSRIPFSSERKWSAVTFDGNHTIIIGAPERLTSTAKNIPTAISSLKSDKRVLYSAYTTEPILNGKLPTLTIIGAIEIADTIRKGAPEALAFFDREGVAVKIISGDNPITVSQTAKQAGLATYNSYVDMTAITTDEELAEVAKKYSVFGRVTPEQKKSLIIAFKNQGHTTAMVGDGVNDVLALREADCGIALANGSEASRQVSQLVLTNSDFTALPEVVMEGRRVINNITKAGGIFFIKTIYSVLLSFLLIAINFPFPFVPIQITIIDLVIEGFPSFFLSFERETQRLKGSFLGNATRRALPFAAVIVAAVCVLFILNAIMTIDPRELNAMMFIVLAFASVASVIRACLPFNKLRLFLSLTSGIGLFVAIFLLSTSGPFPETFFLYNFLEVTIPSLRNMLITILLCVLAIPIMIGLAIFLKHKDPLSKDSKKPAPKLN